MTETLKNMTEQSTHRLNIPHLENVKQISEQKNLIRQKLKLWTQAIIHNNLWIQYELIHSPEFATASRRSWPPRNGSTAIQRWRSIVDPVFKSKRKIDALASSQKISLMVSFEGLRRWFSEEETWPFYTGRYTASQDGTSHWWLYSDCSS